MASASSGMCLDPRRRRVALGLCISAWGVQAIVTQSLLLREALVLMFGSEFAWGVVLFAWLFGVAVGAAAGGPLAARLRPPHVALVIVLLALCAVACVDLWVFRGARGWLGIRPGALLPLDKTALAAMLFVSPAGFLVGMAFPFACCIAGHDGASDPRAAGRGLLSLGHVYALESAGSLIGGAAFSFWAVEHLAPIETALLCGAVTAVACTGVLLASGSAWRWAACPLLIGAAAFLTAVFAGETLGRRLVERRWQDLAPGYELCDEIETRYQNLAIGRRAEQFTLYCNGHVSTDFPDPYTFVPLAHFWMCQHPLPRRVLVLGGGAEGLLAEILKHPVDEIDYVEPDPRQIELVERYLPESDRRALRDARVRVHTLDARYFIKGRHGRYDLVVARLPEPTSALRARFYTDEFYREVRRAMTDRSVLCLTAAAAPADLPAAPATYLASIRATLRRHFPHVTVGWGDTAQILAATDTGLVTTDPAELAARYAGRGVQSDLFHPLWFDGATDWLDAEKLRARSGQLDAAADVQVSTDLHPAVYMQRLAMWEKMTGGPSSRLIERLRSVGLPAVLAVIVSIGGMTLIVCRLRGRPSQAHGRMLLNPWAGGTVVLSIGTTGFATMALSMIWLFAFQNLYGYVYQRIGWIIALFMAGLVIGCWVTERASRRVGSSGGDPAVAVRLWRRLIVVDVLIALLAVAVPVLLPALGAWQDSRPAFVLVEWAISAMVALTGVLCGAAFALAGGLQFIMTGRAGATAGSIVGADHAGACLGALFTGVLLVPVFGTPAAAYLLVGIKLGSVLLLWLVYRAARAA